MINIVVCDDDVKDLDAASNMTKDVFTELRQDCTVFKYRNPEEIINHPDRIDIAVLDIVMPFLNGIELGIKLKEKYPDISIIYTSSYEDYCRQVINTVHAFSFLIKPVSENELKSQLCDCVKKMEDKKRVSFIIFENVRNSKGDGLSSLKLKADDILYCEYVKLQREIAIVLKDETYYLKDVFENLSGRLEKYGFVLNRRGSIVNLKHVKRLKGYSIILDNDRELMLTQKRVSDFKDAMNLYIHADSR